MIGYRFHGIPDNQQQLLLNINLGHSRYLYNRMLADQKTSLEKTGFRNPHTPAYYKHLNDCLWLRDADSLALANVQLHLEQAFQNFYDGRSAFPKFRKKSDHYDSYTTNRVGDNIKLSHKGEYLYLKLPKIENPIKLKAHRRMKQGGRLKSVTVTREPDGKYYFSILMEYPKQEVQHSIDPDRSVGLDMKLGALYVDSNGQKADFHQVYHKVQDKIGTEQRKLSRMKKGSSNYRKQRKYIAKLHAKAKHQREDMLHKASCKLTDEYDIIGIEDLNMKGMSQSLNFGKSVHENGWGRFTIMLGYKAARKGKILIKVGKMFPSSQMCHECGAINPVTKDLSVREWTCPECGHHHDRDINAALNIRDEAIRLYCSA